MRVTVSHSLGDLESDLRKIPRILKREGRRVVQHNIVEGNRIAKAFASEQHTMWGDEDIEYPPSFTSEMTGPMRGEYGPDAAIGDGSQAEGYEHGSINSPPHNDLGRSLDQIAPEFGMDVSDLVSSLFWPES